MPYCIPMVVRRKVVYRILMHTSKYSIDFAWLGVSSFLLSHI